MDKNNKETDVGRKAETSSSNDQRRQFLRACGRFALITPPTMTLLLASGGSFAVAASGGGVSLPGGGGSTTYYVPRDDAAIQQAGGVKPGDTICFSGGCKTVSEPPQ